jgi:hypothetical protein
MMQESTARLAAVRHNASVAKANGSHWQPFGIQINVSFVSIFPRLATRWLE